jgi:hypothetical protein
MPAASLQSFYAHSVPSMGPNSGSRHESYSTNTLGRTNTLGPSPSYEWNSTGMYTSSGTPQEQNRMYKFSDCSLSRYDCGLSAMVDDTLPESQQPNEDRLKSTNHFHHLDSLNNTPVWNEQVITVGATSAWPSDPLCFDNPCSSYMFQGENCVSYHFNKKTKNQNTKSLDSKEDLVVPPTHTSPTGLLMANQIQSQPSNQLLRVLMDSGSDSTFIHSRVLPKGATPVLLPQASRGTTLAGEFTTKRYVQLKDIMLPEFGKAKRIDSISAYVIDVRCQYDIIVGTDFLTKAGLVIDFATRTMQWLGVSIPMKPNDYWKVNRSYTLSLINDGLIDFDDENLDDLACFATEIKEAKYEKVDPIQVAKDQKHLTEAQRSELMKLFSDYEKLFSGDLDVYPKRKLHLELVPGAKPV